MNCGLETQVILTNQQKQGGHLQGAKEEPQKANKQNPDTKLVKKEL